jgi:glycosyltransferase involved in cell wall biosynthesis
MPTVSVVVPNYNHARFLPKRIESILRQTYQDFELILLDDCSTDNSRAILSQYAGDPRVRTEFNEVNSGSTYKQWNKGVRLARGEYVWLAESDDYADYSLLERLVGVLNTDRRIAFAYCRSWSVNEMDQIDGFVYFWPDRANPRWQTDFCVDGREECCHYFARYNPVRNASAVLFRKANYEQVGGADESYRLAGDWKLWAALALTGKVSYVSESLNYQRFHGANTQKNTNPEVVTNEILEVVGWILSRVTAPQEIREEVCKWMADLWVPVLMSPRVPFSRKRAILQELRRVDPRPLRRALRPGLTTLRLKFLRHWRWLDSEFAGP